MPQSDAVLLEKWRACSDADAFAELLSRHASMVYGACLRVVRNPSIAEEVAQECFLELMKGPRGVQCIGAWLHTVATRRALDRVKSEQRRHAREQQYAASLDAVAEVSWDDTREFVDEAITLLPNDLRIPIVLRFLEGRSHEAIAEKLSISRSSARSRIERGIVAIRENLAKRGLPISATALATGLESAAASSVPHAMIAELGKRALALKSGTSIAKSVTTFHYVAVSLLLAGAVASGVWMNSENGDTPEPATSTAAAVTATTPTNPSPPPSALEGTLAAASAPDSDPSVAVEPAATEFPEQDKEKSTDGWRLDLTPSEALKEALQQTVNVSFEDIHIKDIAEYLSDAHGLNVVMDYRVVAPEVIERVEVVFDGPQAAATVSKPIEHDDDDQIIRLPQRYITDGQVRRVDQKGKTVEELLTIITSSINLTHKIRGNAVWISSSAQITEDMTVPLPSAPFNEGEILKTLSSPINVEFEDIHISGVLEYLRESYGVKLVLDTQVVMPQTKVDEGEALATSQFASDGMLDYILMKDTSLAEGLFVMTRLINLTYRVGKDGIYISTPDRLTGSF